MHTTTQVKILKTILLSKRNQTQKSTQYRIRTLYYTRIVKISLCQTSEQCSVIFFPPGKKQEGIFWAEANYMLTFVVVLRLHTSAKKPIKLYTYDFCTLPHELYLKKVEKAKNKENFTSDFSNCLSNFRQYKNYDSFRKAHRTPFSRSVHKEKDLHLSPNSG